MKHNEIINLIKKHHGTVWHGKEITEETTRDRILFGNGEDECTGIAVCIYPSIDVILKTAESGANLIISHECLFWNHGDHTDWLTDNQTYEEKKKLLKENHITVWRDHDRIHAGVYVNGKKEDGIFYGLTRELGLTEYITGETGIPTYLEVPSMPVKDFAGMLKNKMGLSMIRAAGSMDGYVRRIMIANHILGKDNEMLLAMEEKNIDTVLAMELVDFTAAIYVNDSSGLKQNRRILAIGHFDMEEPGMKWFGEVYLPSVLPSGISVKFIKTESLYKYL